ncbi:hypothetical protein AB9P05_22665 [Roseivirga sp. BDSF3-8]|uniref:hypothetical protein n=1 Tax=Roseivirga sp. BDSF3-8 TaxID=3241598 RepID=UPI00353224C6
MEVADTDVDKLKAQIDLEKAEIVALETRITEIRSTFHDNAHVLKKELSDQHEVLRKIIRYANKLEHQLENLKHKVNSMKNLHKTSMH